MAGVNQPLDRGARETAATAMCHLKLTRRSFALLATACIALLASPSAGVQSPATGEPIHLVILHTNDIHGQVLARKATWLSKDQPPDIGGLPRMAAKLAQLRAQESAALLVDAGDWYQGTPEGALEQGLPFVKALAGLSFDAMCVGNHEFDHGTQNAQRLVEQARLPAILANVRARSDGRRLAWTRPWIVVERAGVRIAFVGLLTPETLEITSREVRAYDFATPAQEIDRARAELAGLADLIVPVGHIAVEEARELALHDPKLALIVSGHSHTYLKQGERVGETLIVQSGSKASAVGRVDLWLDPRTFAPLRSEARLIDLLEEPSKQQLALPQVAPIAAACEQLAARAADALKVVVGELTSPLTRAVQNGCSAPGSWIADALRQRMQADIGVHNRGGTRCDLPAGPLTRRDLFELLPFDNDVVAVELSGAQVESFVRRSLESGKHTGMDFSGLRIVVRRETDGTRRLSRIEIDGRAIEPAKRYRVATNSFLAGGGDGAVEFAAARSRTSDPILLRELMEEVLLESRKATLPQDAAQRYVEEAP